MAVNPDVLDLLLRMKPGDPMRTDDGPITDAQMALLETATQADFDMARDLMAVNTERLRAESAAMPRIAQDSAAQILYMLVAQAGPAGLAVGDLDDLMRLVDSDRYAAALELLLTEGAVVEGERDGQAVLRNGLSR
jgi:hypothetical protein